MGVFGCVWVCLGVGFRVPEDKNDLQYNMGNLTPSRQKMLQTAEKLKFGQK